VLRAMSLTDNFARLLLLVGHGADVVNNPAASALQCGACGGHSGAVNARLLAGILNNPSVRDGLAARGLPVPDDTIFMAALHDTVSDTVTLFHDDGPSGLNACRGRHGKVNSPGAAATGPRPGRNGGWPVVAPSSPHRGTARSAPACPDRLSCTAMTGGRMRSSQFSNSS
jgi:uncharacterized protein